MSQPLYQAPDSVPLPPADADVFTTCCDYCIVACGYKVYRWPVGKEGGQKKSQNALGLDFPVDTMSGGWISPNMHNVVTADGKKQNVVVIPDKDSKVVNKGGTHSIRGGCIAQKCFSPDTPTKDRLKHPMARVNGKLTRISWDDAFDIFAEVSNYVLENYGEHAWAQKQYSYQYHENVYALTKFAFRHISTPCFAWHDNPSVSPSVPGFRDVGFDPFGASYEDWGMADTVLISGTDPYETKTIVWTAWMLPAAREHGQKHIFVNPRKTSGPAFAEANGGLFLQIIPGTDTVLHLAIARVIVENGWEDADWIKKNTANKWDSNEGFGQGTRNTPWQWRTTWGALQADGFKDYKKWLLKQKESDLQFAAKTCGVPAAQIVKAAEMMAKPRADGSRPKTSIGIEKGNYWSNNYTNTASIATLGLICGSGNRPGRMVSRLGGHQRGGTGGGSYPRNKGPEKFPGRRRKTLDLDRWVERGHVRFAYVVGTTWMAAMCGSDALQETFEKLTTKNPHHAKSADKKEIIATLKKRVDSGGMVIVNQDIYPRLPIGTDMADLVLPAATWGEEDFTRENGERRLRFYAKFYDAPGEAKPDWWIVAQIAKRMGFKGFDWKNSNEVFEELARFNRGNRRNFQPLVLHAKKRGMTGHAMIASLGTEGIQAPVRIENGKLVPTKRLHDSETKLPDSYPEGFTTDFKLLTAFNTHQGKANFIKSPWWLFKDFYENIKPKGDELWVSNGRINEIWQSGFDDVQRRPYITQRWPTTFLEVHPDDAKKRGIESGDMVEAYSERVPVQTGGFIFRKMRDWSFKKLQADGNLELIKASFKAVAIVTDTPRAGMTYAWNLNPKEPANALSPRVPDPMTNNYRFKLGVGKIKKIGESPYKKDFSHMSFASRTFS